MKVEDLEKKWKGKNSILIYELKERKNESTDDRALKSFREELNEDVFLVDLDKTYRIGKKETQAANHVQLL